MTKTIVTPDVYLDENVVADMVTRYTAVVGDGFTDDDRAVVVNELSQELGKPVQSIRAKLVRENVYIAKTHKTKTGKVVVSKAKLVDNFIELLNQDFTESEAYSFEKATKPALEKAIVGINALYDEIDLADVEVPELEDDAA